VDRFRVIMLLPTGECPDGEAAKRQPFDDPPRRNDPAMNVVSTPFPRAYVFGSDRLLLACTLGYVATVVFEGPIRLGLHAVGAGSLLYLRDLAIAIPVFSAVVSWFMGQANAAHVAGIAALLLVHLAIGLFGLPSAFQALFGFKMFLPLLGGLAVAPVVASRPDSLVRVSRFVFLATALGVGTNLFFDYPWIGLSYDTAFGETTASRQWWSSGELRLPGFTRGSPVAASIALLSLTPLLVQPSKLGLRLCWLLVAVGTIYLTTSKGPMMALPALVVQLVLLQYIRSIKASLVYIAAMAALCLLIPLTTVQLQISEHRVPAVLQSFAQRVVDVWPHALDLLDWWQVAWGRGLGGIGTAQTFAEASRANPGDNLMVYLLVAFGVLGPLYIALFLMRLSRFTPYHSARDFDLGLMHAWTTVWLVNGFTTSMLEDAMVGVAMGIVLGTVLAPATARFLPRGRLARDSREATSANPRHAFGPSTVRGRPDAWDGRF
jgi:hypothetical protein